MAFRERDDKRIDNTPFDTARIPPKQNLLFAPGLWVYSKFMTRGTGLKIEKINMEGLKPPYLVLGSHHSFADFFVTPLALKPHRANYVSEIEGFEAYGEWFFRQFGCLGTRKFISDINLVKNIKRIMDRKGILVLYPEARYANVGTNTVIPDSVGKLIKFLKVPVVVINMHGNYLQSPIWNLAKRDGIRMKAELTKILTPEDCTGRSVEEIMGIVRSALTYDEYKWQQEQGIKITHPKRAEGLHLPLYQCPVCGKEFEMTSEGIKLRCNSCGAEWEKDEDSRLHLITPAGDAPYDEERFSSIVNWYEWQRENVINEIRSGAYHLECDVRVEALPNGVNFINLGDGHLSHSDDGFDLLLTDYGEDAPHVRHFSSNSMFSIHTEYDYRGKGQCVTLSTKENTYFLFPTDKRNCFNATKIQFATEYLWQTHQTNQTKK